MRRILALGFCAAGLLVLAGCGAGVLSDSGVRQDAGPVEHASKTIELDKSEAVRVNLKMGAGELKVRGGSANLCDADFTFNKLFGMPRVEYANSGFRSQLTVEQQGGSRKVGGDMKYVWDVKLNDRKPVSLQVEFGAGEATLDLGTLSLRDLGIKMGVGQIKVDLRGKPAESYNVSIHGGIGQAVIDLPKDVGIVADAHGGIGAINVKGLHKQGERYFNDAYENHPKTTIRLEVRGGIGEIVLNAE